VIEPTTGMPAADLRTDAPPDSEFDAPDVADRSDADLLAAHCAGDSEAFGELFRRHRDRMWAVALRTCGDREIAADAVQDGFLAAFRRADSFRGDAAVTTWLHRIIVNACLDRLRRRRLTTPLPDYDTIETADRRDDHASTEAALDVRAALARLPEGQRVALVLVDMHGMGVAEAAEVLGVAEGTVKSRCARGRAALAELLGLDPRTGRRSAAEVQSDPSGSHGNRSAPSDV
jgi:RNA polymerase sigma-70 factor (ECF subfamily)